MINMKLVTVMSGGVLRELGGIGGPIMNPCKIRIEKIRKMVINGKRVFEHNPKNPEEKILLTEDNVMNEDNFGVAAAENSAPAEPPAEDPNENPVSTPDSKQSPVENPAEENSEPEAPAEEFVPVDDEVPAEDGSAVDIDADKGSKESEKLSETADVTPVAAGKKGKKK